MTGRDSMVTTPLASTDSIPSGVVSRLLLVLSLLLVTPLAAAADEVTVVVKQTKLGPRSQMSME